MPTKTPKTKTGKKRAVKQVMHEFKEGDLASGSGKKITNRKQAIAVALKKAGLSKPPSKRKKKS